MPRRFLAWHSLPTPRHGAAADVGSEAAEEREITQQKTLGTALSWKSVAMDRRMGK